MMTPWTALRQRWQQVQHAPADADCPSPCMSVCVMKTDVDECWGCLRSIEEVSFWSLYTPVERRQVWQRIGLQIQAQASET